MSLLMAFMYALAGIVCINRPALIVKWLAAMLKGAGMTGEPAWLRGGAIVFFIRLMGFLALINAMMYLYLTLHPPQPLAP